MVQQYQSIADRMAQMAQDVAELQEVKDRIRDFEDATEKGSMLSSDEQTLLLGLSSLATGLRRKVSESLCEAYQDGCLASLLETLQAETMSRP